MVASGCHSRRGAAEPRSAERACRPSGRHRAGSARAAFARARRVRRGRDRDDGQRLRLHGARRRRALCGVRPRVAAEGADARRTARRSSWSRWVCISWSDSVSPRMPRRARVLCAL